MNAIAPAHAPASTPSRSIGVSRRWPVPHPYMLAAFPTMALYAHNLDGVMVWELALVLAVSMGVTAVAAILFKPLYANRELVRVAESIVRLHLRH